MRVFFRIFVPTVVAGLLSVCGARAEESFTLAIVPNGSYERTGASISAFEPFYVVATNRSTQPVQVWKEWCSWGYFALSFEVQSPDGSIARMTKKPRGWDKNFPDPFLIPSGGHHVLMVSLREGWEGQPTKDQKIRIRARYKIAAGEMPEDFWSPTKKWNIWNGEIVSPWLDVTYYP